MKLKISLEAILEYIFIFTIIMTGSTMYSVMDSLYNVGYTSYTARIIALFASVILILGYSLSGKRCFTKKQINIFIISIIYFAIYLTITRVNINSCLESLCIPFLLFFIICCMYKPERAFVRYLNIYSTIIVIIAIISLFFYFSGTCMGLIRGTPMKFYNNAHWDDGTNFFYLSFINSWQTQNLFGRTFIRNIGVFMEAPGFAFPLTISFWWELFGHHYKYKFKTIVLLIAMITTFSTKALVFGAVIIFAYLYSNADDKRKFWYKIRWVLFPIIVITIITFIVYILTTKMSMFGNRSSVEIRFHDFLAAFRTWIDYPFFGAGFFNLSEIYRHYTIKRTTGNPTAGVLNILANGGIYMFIGYFGGLYKYCRKIHYTKSIYIVLSFLALFLAFLFTSSSQYDYFTILIIALGWSIIQKNFEIDIGNV